MSKFTDRLEEIIEGSPARMGFGPARSEKTPGLALIVQVSSSHQAGAVTATGVSPEPMGSAHPLNAPYEAFETADGWITIGASNESTWQRLPPVLGLPELLDDERFQKNIDRMRNRDALNEALAPAFKQRETAEWLTLLEDSGVPAGPVLSIGDMLAHPQARARSMVVETEHPSLGPIETIGFPVKFSTTPAAIERGAPRLGEDTVEVLGELGYSAAEVEQLVQEDVVIAIT